MSPFLMPSGIVSLVLVQLYTQGAVPGHAIIPVLSFLASHTGIDLTRGLSSPRRRWQKVLDDILLPSSVEAFETLLHPFPAAVGPPGRRLRDLFLAKLWAVDSLDAFHQFFDRLPTLLASKEEVRHMIEPKDAPRTSRMPLMSNSPLALFVRTSRLEFNKLLFEDVAKLWRDFVAYRQPTAPSWARRNPLSSTVHFDKVLALGASDWGEGASSIESIAYGGDLGATRVGASAHCLDRLIRFQVAQVQSEFACAPCILALSPSQLTNPVTRIWYPRTFTDPTAVLTPAGCQPIEPQAHTLSQVGCAASDVNL